MDIASFSALPIPHPSIAVRMSFSGLVSLLDVTEVETYLVSLELIVEVQICLQFLMRRREQAGDAVAAVF